MLELYSPQDRICATCAHFMLHYIQSSGHYIPIYAGHCVYPRIKNRSCDQTCANWKSPAPSNSIADG